MLFDSALFLWFFAVVFVVYWALARIAWARVAWLLAASWAFYASWNWQLLGLILFSTVLDYIAGDAIHRATSRGARRAWLAASLVGNLGLLAVFKYAAFFATSVNTAADALALGVQLPVLDLVLPVGISFYTFQTLSYTIDIYRDRLTPARSIGEFALFVAFFPQLVAGPIVRASDLLQQLARPPQTSRAAQSLGLLLIAGGLFKKVAIADPLGASLVDRVFASPDLYSSVEVLVGVYAYAVQIYCDFSGYTDVAIGAAMLLGFSLPDNFARPYAATDLQDFWRRWHISLSTWLRDYLYIPLGGNRGGPFATYRNLMITMLLGGLWHGASWTFVLWGALHGGGLAATRMWQRARGDVVAGPVARAVGVLVTFHFVCFAWIVFRSPDMATFVGVLRAIGRGTTYVPNLAPSVLAATFGMLAWHVSPVRWRDRARTRLAALSPVVLGVLLFALALLLTRLRGTDPAPFIYFQF